MPNFVSVAASIAELAMEKNRVPNHSITHPAHLMTPGSEALRESEYFRNVNIFKLSLAQDSSSLRLLH